MKLVRPAGWIHHAVNARQKLCKHFTSIDAWPNVIIKLKISIRKCIKKGSWLQPACKFSKERIQTVYQVATGSGKPVILAVNLAGPCSAVSTFCSGVTTTGGFTPRTTASKFSLKTRTRS